MANKFSKGRKALKAELNKNREENIDKLADIEIDSRSTKHEVEKNRYEQILAIRKEEKFQKAVRKDEKPHIWKRKHIVKRAVVEAEE
jgi:hypothetical protein